MIRVNDPAEERCTVVGFPSQSNKFVTIQRHYPIGLSIYNIIYATCVLVQFITGPKNNTIFYFKMSNTQNEQLEFQLSQRVLGIEKELQLLSTQPIIKSLPILDHNGVPVIHRRTINVIQGKAGSHKSRFAESLCVTLLTCDEDSQAYIGFQNSKNLNYTVCYVDTERSVKEEFTSTIKSIDQNSGFYRPGGTPNFRYTSLKEFPREHRLTALKKFLQDVDQASDYPLFVVLDVATDCIFNFNNIQETYMLLDFLGNLCESNNATFLLVIHENPGSDKARGHTGTEALNKASTVFSIGLSNDL